MRPQHQHAAHPALSERLFVWAELALSGLLSRLARHRKAAGGPGAQTPR